jgi:hypothetical protein
MSSKKIIAVVGAGPAHALGREVVHQDVPFDVYRGLGFPGECERIPAS